jgi:hypothetical protein
MSGQDAWLTWMRLSGPLTRPALNGFTTDSLYFVQSWYGRTPMK